MPSDHLILCLLGTVKANGHRASAVKDMSDELGEDRGDALQAESRGHLDLTAGLTMWKLRAYVACFLHFSA